MADDTLTDQQKTLSLVSRARQLVCVQKHKSERKNRIFGAYCNVAQPEQVSGISTLRYVP
jgi:hypothetical protein